MAYLSMQNCQRYNTFSFFFASFIYSTQLHFLLLFNTSVSFNEYFLSKVSTICGGTNKAANPIPWR